MQSIHAHSHTHIHMLGHMPWTMPPWLKPRKSLREIARANACVVYGAPCGSLWSMKLGGQEGEDIWMARIGSRRYGQRTFFFPLFNVSFALLQSSPFALCLPNRLPTWPQTHESAGIALGPGLKWHVRDWQYVFLCSITSRLRSLKWFTVYIHILIAYHYHYDDDDYYSWIIIIVV